MQSFGPRNLTLSQRAHVVTLSSSSWSAGHEQVPDRCCRTSLYTEQRTIRVISEVT